MQANMAISGDQTALSCRHFSLPSHYSDMIKEPDTETEKQTAWWIGTVILSLSFFISFVYVEISMLEKLKLSTPVSVCLILSYLITSMEAVYGKWWIVVDSFEAGDGTKATIATTERTSNCAALSSWIKDKAMTPSLVDSRVRKLVVRLWDAFIMS